MEITIPILVDGMDDQANIRYAASPDRIYMIGDGCEVVYKSESGPWGYKPLELVDILDAIATTKPAGKMAAKWGGIKNSPQNQVGI